VDHSSTWVRASDLAQVEFRRHNANGRSQTDILKEIAEFLGTTYKKGTILSGLIYMHRISENRVGGIARENFRLFSKICGEDAMRNVLIVTTMWEAIPEEVGARREEELTSKSLFFKDAVDHGARMVRHYNTAESARRTMRTCLDNTPRVLQMQHEVVDEHKQLPQTAAGMELQSELEKQAEQHRQRMQQLKEELEVELARRDARHQEDVDEIRRACSDLGSKMENVEKELRKLRRENKLLRGEKNGKWRRVRLGMGLEFPGAPDIVVLADDKPWQCNVQ